MQVVESSYSFYLLFSLNHFKVDEQTERNLTQRTDIKIK